MLDVSGFLINIIACAMQGHFRSRQRLPSESEIDEGVERARDELAVGKHEQRK